MADIVDEIRTLRDAVDRNTDMDRNLYTEMVKLNTMGDSIKAHESFLQNLILSNQKQQNKVQDFLLNKLGWVMTVALGAALGLKMTGMI